MKKNSATYSISKCKNTWLDYYIHEYIHIIARQFTSGFSKLHPNCTYLRDFGTQIFSFSKFPGLYGI